MAHATTRSSADLADLLMAGAQALAEHLPRAMRGDVKAVHLSRTSSRRLREVLPIVAVIAPSTDVERFERDVRRVTRALGSVRELDVARARFIEAAGESDWAAAAVTRLERTLERARTRAFDSARTKLRGVRTVKWDKRAAMFAAIVRAHPDATVWRRVLAARIRRRATGVIDAVARAGTMYTPVPLHRVRIATKKLRYSLEIGAAAAKLKIAPIIDGLKQVQDELGLFHDLHVLEGRVRAAMAASRNREITQSYAPIALELDRRCRDQHAAFLSGRARLVELSEISRREIARGLAGGARPMIKFKLGAAAAGRARRRSA
jgi:CHAD domain-containing protein